MAAVVVAEVSTAVVVVEVSTAADLAEASTGAAAFTAVASGDITEAGVDPAGAVVGVVMAGDEVGVGTAGAGMVGDAAGDGVGVIPVGAGELVSVLAGAGVLIGEATRTRMAIPMLTPIIPITRTMGRRIRQRNRIDITVSTKIRVTTRSGRIRDIPRRRDHLA